MKFLPFVFAALSISVSGCASTMKQEMRTHEKEGGIWILKVLNIAGEQRKSFFNWRHNKEMKDSEDMLIVGTNSLLTSNPFRNVLRTTASADQSLRVKPGDIVELPDVLGYEGTNAWPPVSRIVCKHTDDPCLEKTDLGLLKKDGTTTRGRYVFIPF